MKVSDLEDARLDYWVAMANGWKPGQYSQRDKTQIWRKGGGFRCEVSDYRPSSDWAYGGPIIEREGIALCRNPDDRGELWIARHGLITTDEMMSDLSTGPTPLIAAMRCFVASKFGDEVDDEERSAP